MQPGESIDPSNPFALHARPASKPRGKAAIGAIKGLCFVAVCFVVVLALGHLSKQWLLHSLTDDFDSLSASEQQARLVQIAELGVASIEPLATALAHQDIGVARTAYDLLRQSQNDWTVLDPRQQHRCQASMIEALESIAIHLPDDRTGWATSLLQQTLLGTVGRSDASSRSLYRDANHAIELLSLSDRSGPSILSDQPLDPMTPRRLAIRAEPLPVTAMDAVGQWTVSPAPNPSEPSEIENSSETAIPSPSVYRSTSSRLQPVETDESVILRDIATPIETSHSVDEIQSVTHLVNSPMEAYSDGSVIHWLASAHRRLRDQAKLELISRGYTETELSIASQIASSDVQGRLELVDKISRDSTLDPRPWLWMLAQDQQRSVRLRVISVLATMIDPEMDNRLRSLLSDESDPTVAARIRGILDLR